MTLAEAWAAPSTQDVNPTARFDVYAWGTTGLEPRFSKLLTGLAEGTQTTWPLDTLAVTSIARRTVADRPAPSPWSTRRSLSKQSRWLPYVVRRLTQMRDEQTPDRGCYPGPVVLSEALHVAATVFDAGTATPSVVPSEEGGVQFVWHRAGWDVELEVEPDGVCVWARNRRTEETWFGTLDDYRQRFSDLLRALSGA